MRSEEIKKEADRLRKDLANAESDFRLALAKNRETWAEEEETHKQLIKDRTAEVEALEARRTQALIPVELVAKQAQAKLEQAEAFAKSLEQERESVEDLQETLENRLDELGQKELDLNHKSALIAAKEQGVALQAEQVTASVKTLNFKASDLLVQTQTITEALNRRKIENSLVEASLLTKSQLIDDKVKKLTQWANNIHEAELEVEKKHRVLMQPVDKLLNEAKDIKLEAQKVLDDAQDKHLEAGRVHQQILQEQSNWQKDLNQKQAELANEELIVKDRRNKVQTEQSQINRRQQELQDLEAELLVKTAQLKDQELTFNNEQDKAHANLDKKSASLEQKQVKITLDLTTITTERERIESLKAEIKQAQERLDQTELKHQAQLKLLASDFAKAESASTKAKDDLKTLDIARQDYAEWQLEAEQKLEKQLLENKAKQKTLADKESKLTRQEKFLAGWNKRLKDERGVLDRAWKELQRKQISPK